MIKKNLGDSFNSKTEIQKVKNTKFLKISFEFFSSLSGLVNSSKSGRILRWIMDAWLTFGKESRKRRLIGCRVWWWWHHRIGGSKLRIR